MRRIPKSTLQAEIARLDGLGLPELREIWQQRIGAPLQLSSTELTRRWLSWELQARVRGGLDAARADVSDSWASPFESIPRTNRLLGPALLQAAC
jgi:hypothetical protein